MDHRASEAAVVLGVVAEALTSEAAAVTPGAVVAAPTSAAAVAATHLEEAAVVGTSAVEAAEDIPSTAVDIQVVAAVITARENLNS